MDALPIEWFYPNEETYNERTVSDIDSYCFHREWMCNDEIKDQYLDLYSDEEYDLVVYDEDGEEIDRVEYTQVSKETALSLNPLSQHQNVDFSVLQPGIAWTIDADPSVIMPGTAGTHVSKYLLHGYIFKEDALYRIQFTGAQTAAVTISITFVFLDEDNDEIGPSAGTVLLATSGAFSVNSVISAPAGAVKYAIRVNRSVFPGPSSGTTVDIDSLSISLVKYVNDVSFIPTDLSLCESRVRFKTLRRSDDAEIRKSDIAIISNDIRPNYEVYYKGSKQINGIYYDDNSEYFMIRIPSIFFHEPNLTESKLLELSGGNTISTGSVLRKQKKMGIRDCPYYFHDKIQLVLMHSSAGSVVINDVEWTWNNEYNYDNNSPESYPMRRAEVFLRRKNYTKRTVI